jgi:hypothetical protein
MGGMRKVQVVIYKEYYEPIAVHGAFLTKEEAEMVAAQHGGEIYECEVGVVYDIHGAPRQ